MGLLLSVLVACVGVLEVIACYTHFRLGITYNQCKSDVTDIARNYAWELRRNHLHHLFPDGQPELEYAKKIKAYKTKASSTDASISVDSCNVITTPSSTSYLKLDRDDENAPSCSNPVTDRSDHDDTTYEHISEIEADISDHIETDINGRIEHSVENETNTTKCDLNETKIIYENREKAIDGNICGKTEIEIIEENSKQTALQEPSLNLEIDHSNDKALAKDSEIQILNKKEIVETFIKENRNTEETIHYEEYEKYTICTKDEHDWLQNKILDEQKIDHKEEIHSSTEKDVTSIPLTEISSKNVELRELSAGKENIDNTQTIKFLENIDINVKKIIENENHVKKSEENISALAQCEALPTEIQQVLGNQEISKTALDITKTVANLTQEIESKNQIRDKEVQGDNVSQNLQEPSNDRECLQVRKSENVENISALETEIKTDFKNIVNKQHIEEVFSKQENISTEKEPQPKVLDSSKNICVSDNTVSEIVVESAAKAASIADPKVSAAEKVLENREETSFQENTSEKQAEITDLESVEKADKNVAKIPEITNAESDTKNIEKPREIQVEIEKSPLVNSKLELIERLIESGRPLSPLPENAVSKSTTQTVIPDSLKAEPLSPEVTSQVPTDSTVLPAREPSETDLECEEILKKSSTLTSNLQAEDPLMVQRVPSPYPMSLFGITTDNGISDLMVNEDFLRSLDGVKRSDDRRRSFRKKRNSSSSSRASRDRSIDTEQKSDTESPVIEKTEKTVPLVCVEEKNAGEESTNQEESGDSKVSQDVSMDSPVTEKTDSASKSRKIFKKASVSSFEEATPSQNEEMNRREMKKTNDIEKQPASFPQTDAFWVNE